MKALSSTFVVLHAIILTALLSGCGEVPPPEPENEEEIINRVSLSFTSESSGATTVFIAFDPDGEGPAPVETDHIALDINESYLLSLKLENTFTGDDITPEILEEGDEHLFFFGWTDGLFNDPPGNGNLVNRENPLNYADEDENGLPIGLETKWNTGKVGNGTFRIVLKHQPDIKSANSSATDGATDTDITFSIEIS